MISNRNFASVIIDILSYGFIVLTLILAAVPILWTVLSSFKFAPDIAVSPPKIFFSPTLENYRTVISHGDFFASLWSSAKVTISATVLALIVGTPAAYFQARSSGRVAMGVGGIVMSIRFIPVVVLLIPLLITFRTLGLVGSPFGLMIAYQLATLPFVILVVWAAFTQIPSELEDAVLIDGGTQFTAFLRIYLPMAAPSVGAATILAALFSWNQFIIPIILGSGGSPLAIMGIARYSGGEEALADWGALSVYATILMLPMIFAAFVVQKHLIAAFGGDASTDSG